MFPATTDSGVSQRRSKNLEENSDSKFFVEIMDNGITGSISAIINDNMAELRDFYVIEGAEDSALRSILLEKALNYCQNRNIDTVKAVIFPDISNFFRQKGFEEKMRLHSRFIAGEELLIMTKKI